MGPILDLQISRLVSSSLSLQHTWDIHSARSTSTPTSTNLNPKLSPSKTNMDFVKNAIGGGSSEEQKKEGENNESGGGFMDKINTMAGGGKASEKDEDALDKGIDAFQQYGMGQGPQNNESAVEQAKDEAISDY